MTREEFINWFEERFALTKNDIYEFGQLYDEVTKPHWISVEDELPMEYEPVLAAFGNHYARVCFYSGGKWYIDAGVISDEVFGVSHWMQISPPQAPSSPEFPNNCEKGGEE